MKKILYIEPNNNQKKFLYYTNLGKSLSQNKDINLVISKSFKGYNLNDFNLIIIGYGGCADGNFCVNGNTLNTTTPIIGFLFKLSVEFDKKINFLKKNKIIIFGQHTRIPEFEQHFQIKVQKVLYPFDDNIFFNRNLDKIYDIGMTGALHNHNLYSKNAYLESELDIRERLIAKLESVNYKKYIKCGDSYECRIVDHNEYSKIINQTRIWMGTIADYGDITPRISEIFGCKTLLFFNEIPFPNEFLVDGQTCVFYKNDLSDLYQKLNYYLSNPSICEQITTNAYNMVHSKFSNKNISKLFLQYS